VVNDAFYYSNPFRQKKINFFPEIISTELIVKVLPHSPASEISNFPSLGKRKIPKGFENPSGLSLNQIVG
jgi:hypothetical protein